MSKVATYLQDHLVGEVTTTPAARSYFSTDASLLKQIPQIVVSPKDEQDVRKVTRFAWQLAERGKILPIVARGAGTDLSGAAIGQVISLALTPHMNKVLQFDDKKGITVLQPGVNFGRLQHMLSFSHGRYIPSYPNSYEYSTVGGAVVNNAGGERSLRYGPMDSYVEGLRVVLANGEVIETGRVSKREASKKMGVATLEGEIYRAVDALLNESDDTIKAISKSARSNVGYNIAAVRDKDGSVDLTPLFVGSKGTLGVITQVTLSSEAYRPDVSTLLISLKDRSDLSAIAKEIVSSDALTCEYYDASLLALARKVMPSYLETELGKELPAGLLVADFIGMNDRAEQKLLKKLSKKLKNLNCEASFLAEDKKSSAEQLKRLIQTLMTRRFGSMQLVPGIEEAALPPESLSEFLTAAEELFKNQGVSVVVSARAGEGIVHSYPMIDLGQLGDRQRIGRLSDEYYKLVISSGGSVSVEHGDGRTRGGYVKSQLGDVLYDVMRKVKQIFDPYGIMNPGVKIDVITKANFPLLRQEYELHQLYNH